MVRYVKQNFLYNRPFVDIDMLNTEALAWLARTANKLPHSFTGKPPVEEWEKEKPFLNTFHSVISARKTLTEYAVRKDNSFSYKGNFYSLPGGTYKGRGCKVLLEYKDGCIILFNSDQAELCRHQVNTGRGEKIINNDHRREKTGAIKELEDQLCSLVINPEKGRQLVAAIRQDKPRYLRDQLLILLQVVRSNPRDIIDDALTYCQQERITGAADFKAIVAHYHQLQTQDQLIAQVSKIALNPLNNRLPNEALIQPATSSINDYDMF